MAKLSCRGSFGSEADDELFPINNSILMLVGAKERLDKGFMVIVQFITDDKSANEVNEWRASHPKRYMVRVIDRDAAKMRLLLPWSDDRASRDIDDQELIFPSDHGPRACYLFFQYCVAMLKRSWHHNGHEAVLRDEMGKKLWAVPGPYVRKQILLAFVEDIEDQRLLEGAEKEVDRDIEADPLGVAVANDALNFAESERSGMFTDRLVDSDEESS